MIDILLSTGRWILLNPKFIDSIDEAEPAKQYVGINAIIRTSDGRILEAISTFAYILQAVKAAERNDNGQTD